MKFFPIVLLTLCYFDIKAMWKKGLKREIVIYSVLALLVLSYGYYYIFNKNNASIVSIFFKLFGYK